MVDSIIHTGPFVLPGSKSVVEIASPGWLGLGALGELTGGNLTVHAGDFGYELLVNRVGRGSAWFVDDNENGLVDTSERDTGPFAEGEIWTSEYGYDDDND